MVFKVFEAEHLQGRQIEQKVDSTLFFLLIIRCFIIVKNKTTYLFYWVFIWFLFVFLFCF